MLIDCHGHYTTTPPGVETWRNAQKDAVAADPAFVGEKGTVVVSDDPAPEPLIQLKLIAAGNADGERIDADVSYSCRTPERP